MQYARHADEARRVNGNQSGQPQHRAQGNAPQLCLQLPPDGPSALRRLPAGSATRTHAWSTSTTPTSSTTTTTLGSNSSLMSDDIARCTVGFIKDRRSHSGQCMTASRPKKTPQLGADLGAGTSATIDDGSPENEKAPVKTGAFAMATWMGLEPTTSAVTGRRSNQLSYQAKFQTPFSAWSTAMVGDEGFGPPTSSV